MKNPLVSVVMTVYNCEEFVKESLESIFNQNFKDFEIIVFNDSSEDKTFEIINNTVKYFDGDYTIINRVVGDNVGCAAGRNLIIERARGKYIVIQDGDDISHSNRLEKEVSFLEKNSSIFCVGSWADVIDEQGEKIDVFNYPPLNHNHIIKSIYKMVNPIIDPSSMFKRDVFSQLGGYDEEWNVVPDLHLWVKAMLKGYSFANIAEKLISYRKHKNNITKKYSNEMIRQHKLLFDTVITKYKKRVFLHNN